MQSVNTTGIRQATTVRVVSSLPNAVIVQGSSVSSTPAASGSQQQHRAHAVLQPVHTAYSSNQPIIVTIANHGDDGSKTHDLSTHQRSTSQVVYQTPQSYSEYGNSGSYQTQYYHATETGTMIPAGVGSHVITEAGESYLIQTNMDTAGGAITHTIRASPVTVQWLLDNYETAESVSLPRSTLYNHYIRHCHDNKLEPMNPASFGKLIRSVFPGLRTRRLGTRGNSQYHYYGIRIKSMSPLNQISDAMMANRAQSFAPARRPKSESEEGSVGVGDGSGISQQSSSSAAGANQQSQHRQYLGDVSDAVLPEFGHIELTDEEQMPEGITDEHLAAFENSYKDHCQGFLDIVINLKFNLIDTLWMSFWKVKGDTDCDEVDQPLTADQLYALCEMPAVQQFVRQSDYTFYQTLVHVLVPDVLRPIPSVLPAGGRGRVVKTEGVGKADSVEALQSNGEALEKEGGFTGVFGDGGQLTQAIRNFAKNLEGWLKNAMSGAPEEMTKIKMVAVRSFAQILRRYTSLNHLAQAARAVLQNSNQITQMLTDLNKVDFTSVQEQASWVCRCDDDVIKRLEQDFKQTLQNLTSLEQWAAWLEGVVDDALSQYLNSSDFPRAARQFLLKWSFYSAASFGSFHLIRLLYDEYMFYLIEHKVAASLGETSIAVMADYRHLLDVDSNSLSMSASASPAFQQDTVVSSSQQQVNSPPAAAAAANPSKVSVVKSSSVNVAVSSDVVSKDGPTSQNVDTLANDQSPVVPQAASGRTAVIHPISVASESTNIDSVTSKPPAKRVKIE